VEISGNDFGDHPGSVQFSGTPTPQNPLATVRIGGGGVSEWKHFKIKFKIPAATGSGGIAINSGNYRISVVRADNVVSPAVPFTISPTIYCNATRRRGTDDWQIGCGPSASVESCKNARGIHNDPYYEVIECQEANYCFTHGIGRTGNACYQDSRTCEIFRNALVSVDKGACVANSKSGRPIDKK
jgi:hypothetical protein